MASIFFFLWLSQFLVEKKFQASYEFTTRKDTLQRAIEESIIDSTSRYANWDLNPKKIIEISLDLSKAKEKQLAGEYYKIKYRADLNFSKQLIQTGILKETKAISSKLFKSYPHDKLKGIKIIFYLPCETYFGFESRTRFVEIELIRKLAQEINWSKIRLSKLKELLRQKGIYKIYPEKDKDLFFFKPSCKFNLD